MKIKKFFVFTMVCVLICMTPIGVCAEESVEQPNTNAEQPAPGNETPKTEAEKTAELEQKEREDSYARSIDTNSIKNWPQGPAVYADSAVLMDMDSGAILYAKNADAKHYPASITKLLTVLVALENAQLTDTVKFTEDSVSFLQYDDASIGMKPGEEINLSDALHGILLASANEVSHAVAESVGAKRLGGNYDTFIQKMNDRAMELGCTNSHWVNTNGLHDDQHYTTAHDMALIASAVYKQETFRNIMDTLEYKIGFTNITKEERVFQQNHKMLWPENYYYYEHSAGGKTGYTDQAKTTLVTMADDGNTRLAAVVLYDYGVDAYNDTRAMFDYGFSQFSKSPIHDISNREDIQQFKEENPYVLLPKDANVSQVSQNITLTQEGIRTGEVTYSYEGQLVGKTSVILTEAGYQKHNNPKAENIPKAVKGKKNTVTSAEKIDNLKLKLIIAIVATILFLIIIVSIVLVIRNNRKRRRRKRGKRRNK